MTGQTGPSGGLARKRTGFTSNSPYLLKPLAKFKCDGSHEHENLDGGRSEQCKLWTWKMSSAVVDGILLLKHAILEGYDGSYLSVEELTVGEPPERGTFPAASTSTEKDPKPSKLQYQKCPGCKGHQSKTDDRHSRIPGECRFPFDASEPVSYTHLTLPTKRIV